MNWTSAIRVLFHIGDKPCHGTEYHDRRLRDDYPKGDPYGLQPVHFLKQLAEKSVYYYFGRLTKYTDMMIQVFNTKMRFDYIKSSPMSNLTMMDVINRNVAAVMSITLSYSFTTDGFSAAHTRPYCLVKDLPTRWSDLPVERVVAYSLTNIATLRDLCAEDEGALIVDAFPTSGAAYIQRTKNPFGKGKAKLAYYARAVDSVSAGAFPASVHSLSVIKQSVNLPKHFNRLKMFAEYLAPQRAGMFLAALYTRTRPSGTPAVTFVDTRLVHFVAEKEKPYFIEDEYISGQWERYNNNTGYCAPCPTQLGTDHRAVQAFSHWTYHVSGEKLMVVDCQGCFDAARNTFVLTDPAVHCTRVRAYGGTNLGEKGFDRFFQTHRCNDICRALDLPAEEISDDETEDEVYESSDSGSDTEEEEWDEEEDDSYDSDSDSG